jgi:lipopolysaccharide transport system ATP-binding protein
MFACFEPEVFLIDEALSVGDALFQQRCAARIREMLAGGTTMMFVSHDTAAVHALCDQAMVLSKGTVAFHGAPAEAVSRYFSLLGAAGGQLPGKWAGANARSLSSEGAASPPLDGSTTSEHAAAVSPSEIEANDIIGARASSRHGVGGLRIVAAAVTDQDNVPTRAVPVGQAMSVHMLIEAVHDIARPRAGLRIHDRLGTHIFSAGTDQARCRMPAMSAGQRVIVRLDVTMNLKPGPYTLSLTASEPGDGPNASAVFHDQIDSLGPLHIAPPSSGHLAFFGLVQLPMRAAWAACPSPATRDA